MWFGYFPSKLRNDYKLTDAKLGIREITFYDVKSINGKIVVYGNNFNEFTKISIDDDVIETKYIDSGKIICEDDLYDLHSIKIVQVDETGNILSYSKNEAINYN